MSVATETPVKVPVQTDEKTDKLNTRDRCDKCSAQAYVDAVLTSGNNLMFCNHHWMEVEAAINPYVEVLTDERWKLTYNRHMDDED